MPRRLTRFHGKSPAQPAISDILVAKRRVRAKSTHFPRLNEVLEIVR